MIGPESRHVPTMNSSKNTRNRVIRDILAVRHAPFTGYNRTFDGVIITISLLKRQLVSLERRQVRSPITRRSQISQRLRLLVLTTDFS